MLTSGSSLKVDLHSRKGPETELGANRRRTENVSPRQKSQLTDRTHGCSKSFGMPNIPENQSLSDGMGDTSEQSETEGSSSDTETAVDCGKPNSRWPSVYRKARELTAAENKQDDTTELLEKQIAKLKKHLTDLQRGNQAEALCKTKTENQPIEFNRTRPKRTTGATAQPKEFFPSKERTCWGCSDSNHRSWQCLKLSYAEKMKLDRREVRPIGGHSQIIVRYNEKPIEALVDIGSNVTVAGFNIAEKHRWKIRNAELKSVETANGEYMIDDLVTEDFSVGKKRIQSDIYISPDLDDLILGKDWVRKQGRMLWDFEAQQIRFGDGEWIALRLKTETGCQRLCTKKDVVLLPKQEMIVPDRLSRNIRKTGLSEADAEGLRMPRLGRLHSNRSAFLLSFWS